MSEKELTTDAAIQYLESIIYEDFAPYTQKCLLKVIEVAREAEPVRHGEWLPTRDSNKKECSNCGVIHLIAQYPHGQVNYCPNCGEKMKAGDQNE